MSTFPGVTRSSLGGSSWAGYAGSRCARCSDGVAVGVTCSVYSSRRATWAGRRRRLQTKNDCKGAAHASGDDVAEAPVPTDLTARVLEELLGELVQAYTGPGFQAEISQLHASAVAAVRQRAAGRDSKSNAASLAAQQATLRAVMGPVVLKYQAPVLQKFGLPPDASGVELMKHAVQRRVAEGARRVEELANEARRILGFEPMPDRSVSAEKVLAGKVEETVSKLGLRAPGGPSAIGEKSLCLIEAALEGGNISAASAAGLQQILRTGSSSVPSALSLLQMARLGIPAAALGFGPDGSPLRGKHGSQPGLAAVELNASVTSPEFWQHCVLPNRPAVIRHVASAIGMGELMRNFADLGFLRRRCGHRRVLVKSLAHDDTTGRPVFVSDPELKLPLAAFLDGVVAHEEDGARVPFYLGKVPLAKELPELAQDIQAAPSCPEREYGTCFGPRVPEGVFTYFGCARNTTPVHFDAHENLMLCVCGTKRLWLYPPSDARYLYPTNDWSRSAVLPFMGYDELTSDLQERYSLVQHASPVEVIVHPGDILYLPMCWWHCVEGSDDRNMILNWWFLVHPEKRACATA